MKDAMEVSSFKVISSWHVRITLTLFMKTITYWKRVNKAKTLNGIIFVIIHDSKKNIGNPNDIFMKYKSI